jgi:hypothetical protein
MAREGEEDDGHYERGNTKMQGGGRETRANAAEGTAQQAADPDTAGFPSRDGASQRRGYEAQAQAARARGAEGGSPLPPAICDLRALKL